MLLDLRGKKALVTGIANNKSIAWGIAQLLPEALPVVAPAQLIDQFFAALPAAGAGEHGIAHFGQREHTVADVGGEPGDRPIKEVAPLGVALRLDAVQQRLGLAAAAADGAERARGLREQLLQFGLQGLAAVEAARQLARLLGPGQRHAGEGIGGQGLRRWRR